MAKQNKSNQKSPLAALHRLEFILQHKSDQLLKPQLGIGFSQVRIMEELDSARARTQRELAHRLYQTEANISRQLKVLQKEGLVTVARKDSDKRQRQVTLTSKGAQAFGEAQIILAGLHKELMAKIDYRDAYNFGEIADKLAKTL